MVKREKIVLDSLPSISSMDWQKSCGCRKQGNSSVEGNPTRALRLELRNVKSWKSVLGSSFLCLLCSYTFSTGTYCLAGSWLFLQVWRALCPQSDRFLVEGVEEPVAFYSSLYFRTILLVVCTCKHCFRVPAFVPKALVRHWPSCSSGSSFSWVCVWNKCSVSSNPDLYWTGSPTAWHLEELFEGLNSVTSFSRDGRASLGHQPAIVELFSASFFGWVKSPSFLMRSCMVCPGFCSSWTGVDVCVGSWLILAS